MPRLAVITVRLALLHLLAGWTLGALLLIERGGVAILPPGPWLLLHAHLLLFGFVVQLCVGVGFWIFPKFVGRDRPLRGTAALATGGVVALEVGVLASVLAPTLSALAYALAALLVGAHLAPRAKDHARARGAR